MRALGAARTWIPACLGALAAGAVVIATRALDGKPAAALLFELEALAAGLGVPWLAARALEDEALGQDGRLAARAAAAGLALAGAGVVAVALGIARGEPGAAGAVLAQVLVALEALAIGGFALAVGARGGAGAGLATGLALATFLLGLPYLSGDLLAALPRPLEALGVYWLVALAPGIALAGTCAGTEPFHSAVLYERFRPIGEGHVGFQHASPARALAVQGTLAALGAGLAFTARRLARSRAGVRVVAGTAVVLVLLLLAPGRADAQDILGAGADSGSGGGSSDQGSLGVSVRLGYLYPFLEGNLEVKANDHAPGSRLDFTKDIHLQAQYILPTFDLQLGMKGVARVWGDYFEMRYQGNFLKQFEDISYRNVVIPAGEVGLLDYTFRTVGLHGAFSIPILDFITLELIATTRYAYFKSQIRAPRVFGTKDQAHLEAIIPGIGPGFEVFIFDHLYAYGDLAWIDFSMPKKNPLVHYREGHLGLRLELFDHLVIGAECVWLDIDLQNSRYNYVQRILGPRIWAGVQF